MPTAQPPLSTDRFVARIRDELRRLPLTAEQQEKLVPRLLQRTTFLDTDGRVRPPGKLQVDSSLFNFAAKLQGVVARFEEHGLTLDDYLRAAIARPELFYQAPASVVQNIATTVTLFAEEGLTPRRYLAAALAEPTLFTQSAATTEAKIAGTVARLAKHGLSRRAYFKSALRNPTLFTRSPDSIAANLQATVTRLADAGLTMSAWLGAAVRQPSLFALSPAKIDANIADIVAAFAEHKLTRRQYVRAALKQPSLFYLKPQTVVGNITALANEFGQAVSSASLVRAALAHPTLFYQSPLTVSNNIRRVAQHYATEGLGVDAYLDAATRAPQLFSLTPHNVTRNIEDVVAAFVGLGLTTAAYLKAALRQPQLFYRSPATLIAHINLILHLYDQEVFVPPKAKSLASPEPHHPHAAVIRFLLTEPRLICLEERNLQLRQIHKILTGVKPSPKNLTRSRAQTELEVMAALGHPDGTLPVLDDSASDLPAEQRDELDWRRIEQLIARDGRTPPRDRRALLAALIRQGYLKSAVLIPAS